MAPFVSLIHAMDSAKLLKELDKEGKKNKRILHCLLQLKIAKEESKYGLNKEEALAILTSNAYKEYTHVKIIGLMGMATFTQDKAQIASEFSMLKECFVQFQNYDNDLTILSMGMSGDYSIAIEQGSTMVRIGSAIFG